MVETYRLKTGDRIYSTGVYLRWDDESRKFTARESDFEDDSFLVGTGEHVNISQLSDERPYVER
ncbi:MAG: hypothetical protein AB1401_00835 [Thermodesulfobacteriota bacterium]